MQTKRELRLMGGYFLDSELMMCQREYEQWLQLAKDHPLEELEISVLVSDEKERIYIPSNPSGCSTETPNTKSKEEIKPLSTNDIQMLLIKHHQELENQLMTTEIISERVAVDNELTQLENAIAEMEMN